MRTPKRIIALVMAIAMMSTCGVSTAFAAARADDTDTTPPADQAYSIAVAKNDNATVSVKVGGKEVTKAKEGDNVTVVAKGINGYVASTVNITAEGNPSSIHTPAGNGTYTFTMPAKKVTIAVTTTLDNNPMYSILKTGNKHADILVTVDGNQADKISKGKVVLVTVTGKAGYWVSKVNITAAGSADFIGKPVAGKENTYTFTMPDKDVTIAVTTQADVLVPQPIDPSDVDVTVPEGTTAGGKAVDGVTTVVAEGKEVTQIADAMAGKLSAAGLKALDYVSAFTPIDIKVVDAEGNTLTGTLNKPVTVSIDVSVDADYGFVPSKNNMRILHNHNGTVEVIRPSSVTGSNGNYKISFPMSRFSVVQLVAVDSKSTGGTGSSSDSYSGGSSGGGGTVVDREFDGNKMYLTGGENVSAKVVEEIAGTDKVYTVVYRGQTYTFNGKNVAKPGKGVIYYTAEEFMKLVQGKLVSSTGTVGGEGNPDTGANDFVGLAMALGMVSLAGIAACGVAKKK